MTLSFILFAICLPFVLADDYSSTAGGAFPISLHQTVTGYIDYGGDLDYFQISLLSYRTYQITMESSFDNYLRFLNPSLSVLSTADDVIGRNAQISWTPVTAGTYYIEARALGTGTTGSYTIGVVDRTPCSPTCIDCEVRAAPCGICSTGYVCHACSNSPSPVGIGGACPCGVNEVYTSGSCYYCGNFMSNCIQCNTTTLCTDCSGSYLAYGSGCVIPCPSGAYSTGVICKSCSTLHGSCTTCNSSSTCTSCSGGLVALGSTCIGTCPAGTYDKNGLCTSCKTLNSYCTSCNSSISCTGCSNSRYALGSTCVTSCPVGTYLDNGICTSCKTLDAYCLSCSNSTTCTSCSNFKHTVGPSCLDGCPDAYYLSAGVCISCTTLNTYCVSCNSSDTCTECSNSKYALGKSCVDSCPLGTYNDTGICTSCKTLDSSCQYCNSSLSCTSCTGGLSALGPFCVANCPSRTYKKSGICTSCETLDNNCTACNSSVSCLGCSGGLVALGPLCVFSCPVGTYDNNGLCTSCRTLDSSCAQCSNNRFCSLCEFNKLIFGSHCVSSCPAGTRNTEGICSSTAYSISLAYTDSVTAYMVDFPSALVYDANVSLISSVTLENIDPLQYNYTLTKKANTVYQIDFQITKSIPSTTLTFRYTLNGSPPSSNILIGRWTARITSKYMAYMSEAEKAVVGAINQAVGGAMQGAASGAGSMAFLGGNPALLWPLLNLFQAFYYLIFIDVNYPANVQMFLKIFSLGSLGFIPNPLEWFVQDIDNYNLEVPPRYNDYNFSGLFLDNSGNELLFLVFVIGLYLISKIAKKWMRKLPTSLRLMSNKTVEWFEWSGILRSLITSYTDIAQAIFLQMRVLTFYSTVFTISSVLTFVALGFIVIFPAFIFLIVRKFDDHPELLCIKYDTLVKGFDLKKKSARQFIAIWLVRRLIMCLSLVFLQGYSYLQISVLCLLVIGTIYHTWAFKPYATRKENICNTIIEILFGLIHGVIYVLIHDDHSPCFSDKQRLQMGWIIIFACGVILMISLGVSLIEQFKEVIRGIKLLKQLLSKPQKKKIKKKKEFKVKIIQESTTTLAERSSLFDMNRTQLETVNDLSLSSQSGMNQKAHHHHLHVSRATQVRRAKVVQKIRHLREINS